MYFMPEFGLQGWMDDAACLLVMDPNMFFPSDQNHEDAIRKAKNCCRDCPVVNKCLAYAMEEKIDHGVWGGLTSWERKKLREEDPA